MTSTFIVGFDGSDGARAAVRFATRIAGALRADVVAVNGYIVPRHVFGKGASDGGEAAIADDSRAEADLALAELHEDGVTKRVVRAGSPAQALIEAADELEADLIVVGTHEAHGVERLKLGSTGERVVHGAPCAVSIVPHGVGADELRTVAVAYDGREPAQTALEYGAALARALSARLVMISVVDPFPEGHIEQAGADEHYQASVTDTAAEALRPQLDVEVRTESGDPGEAIVAACGHDVDLLVTGSRAYGPVHAALAGSVSHYLAGHSRCPVIVVPRQVRRMPDVAAPVS
jgi:nucleotide-binding universal stress UspA family protein